MDQAQGLRELKRKQLKMKSLDVYLTTSDEALILEKMVEALEEYGYQAILVATAAVKPLFRAKAQDRLFSSETVKNVTSANVHLIIYVHLPSDLPIDRNRKPLFLFIRPDKETLVQHYHLIKRIPAQKIYTIGTGSTNIAQLQQGLINLSDTVTRFLAKETTAIGIVPLDAGEDWLDYVYESTGLLVREVLLA